MAELIRYIKKRIMLIILFPLRILPIRKNRVFLHNDLAQKYSDNPKVVAERLLSSFPGRFQIVYSVKEKTTSSHLAEKGILPVKYLSLQYYYYAMTSHVFLTNSGGFSYLPLKTNQYVINTWHGGGAYKKVGIYMYGNTPLFRKDLQLSAKKTNVFLSSSSRFTEIISESMLIPRSCFWEIGMPRNDNLVQIMPNMREEIQKSLGLRDNEKLVLYAPTYRKPADDYFQESIGMNYGIDPERVCFALQKRFGGKWKFAFRLHPRITNRSAIPHGFF